MSNEKPISQAKLEANRRALEPSGASPERSRRGLKHGLLAKEVVVRGGPLGENPRQFQALLDQLLEDLQPVGACSEERRKCNP